MTEFLLKTFLKTYKHGENDPSGSNRTAVMTLASVVGILCNTGLFAVKFILGMVLHSLSVTADSFNNLSDASSSIISLVGAKLAGQPADKEHPFGHGRIEYLSTLIVTTIITAVGVMLGRDSVGKILHPEPTSLELLPFVLLLLSVGVKLWLSSFNRKAGTMIDSTVLLATADDARNDVITTSAAIASLVIEHLTGLTVDGWFGLAVSIFVIYSGLCSLIETISLLIGTPENPELAAKIEAISSENDSVLGVHDLIIHSYGPDRWFASEHMELPASLTFTEAHSIADEAERNVRDRLDVDLVIHTDPVSLDDSVRAEALEEVTKILTAIDPALTCHDFRVVQGKKHKNLIFDIVVPYSYKEEDEENLIHEVQHDMHLISRNYHCHIRIDRDYVA
ncbi:MAG: cation diffusion facilitator family transporter [Lachnospiraceae bacterium]|nr:cation diffusion facilitator family transporter [Lachnospiraceae bacterium]